MTTFSAKRWRKRTSTWGKLKRSDTQQKEHNDQTEEDQDTPKLKKKVQTKAELLARKKARHKEELEKKRRQNAKNRINDQLNRKAEIKSCDFVSTPTQIKFADYLPGQRYVVKIDLTNVSHQISSIRYHSLRLVVLILSIHFNKTFSATI